METFNNEPKSRMDEIYKITSILIKNEEGALSEILNVACSVLEAETGIICNIIDDKYRVLDYFSTIGSPSLKGEILNLSNTFCEFTIQENKVLSVDDIKNSNIHKNHPSCTDFGLGSYIGIPISFNESEIGTLSFSSKKAKETPYSQTDRDFVQYLGQWVSNYFDLLYFKRSIQDKNELLEELNQQAEEKNKELKEIMDEKNQLMQILVHDLKSPLSNIQMLSYLFQEFSTDSETEELVGIFNKSLKDVFHLIDQMETLNSVENFELSNFIEQFNLKSFIDENIKNFQNTADSKSIKLNFKSKGNDFNISSDQNFLKRIFNNLLSNALKFSPFEKSIHINLVETDDGFKITVTDEGPGISEEDKVKLFNKFSSLKNKPTNNESSSGLGLFIVKELAKHLNAKIEVESSLESGSTFSVFLPKILTNKT
ncbi:MAG: GAF domain-containing sensor histidine kinase [Bacteroidetes bacterium]|nr:GAF domain-containing sensor histidine kinase [Bacteroidota bacterium]MBU1484674.1 GAF domain-containing sensor histidine kinase [Bacteroidota bacterium]MBU2268330.1 GAF domain-containing sensor histidine kinase [Bacteroidota bacterium]MBU2376518.1 GAF domain-containing sensor histidine kinase [Bacteroidota bacterium]